MFSIFKATQLDLLRSKFELFFIVLFPSILVFLLGTMLASLDNADSPIETMSIEYVVESSEPLTVQTVDELVAQFDDVEDIRLIASTDLAGSRERLEGGELSAVIVFEEPFALRIYEGNDDVQNRAVHMVFEGVSRIVASYEVVAAHMMAQQTNASNAGALGAEASGAENTATGNSPTGSPATGSPTDTETSLVGAKSFGASSSMMDYYAVTMIVMIMFMGGAGGSALFFYEARKEGTLRRVLVSPHSRVSIYLQYVLRYIPMCIVQVLIVMLMSSTFFGAHYAATWQANALLFFMLFAAGFACNAVALVIGMFLYKVNPMPILMPLMWVILFLGGTFNKGVYIEGFSNFMPPYAIQVAAFDLVRFGNSEKSIVVIIGSCIVLAAAMFIGSILFNRRKVSY